MTGSAAALKLHIENLIQTLSRSIGRRDMAGDEDKSSSQSHTMNVEAPSSLHHQYPLSSNHKQLETVSNTEYTTCRIEVPVANLDMSQPAVPNLGSFLPALFEQAKSNGGLSSVPQPTLKENLEMVISALERLDAEALLDLKIFPEQRLSSGQQPPGPRVRDGVYCRPINDLIQPAVERQPHHSCVRYLHVCEVPDQYSIGIFVFGPKARIPLHDHPDMCVLSRVLYGDLIRLSLDLARPEEAGACFGKEGHKQQPECQSSSSTSSSWFRNSWFGRNNGTHPIHNNLPKGAKAAFKNEIDHLQAPDVTVLYPYEGNLHEFVAGPQGAAVLDVLLPPYDNVQNRDCTFYNIHNVSSNGSKACEDPNHDYDSEFQKKEPCFIVPTGQPENFHCISGQYRDLGESSNLCDDDHEDDSETMDEDE